MRLKKKWQNLYLAVEEVKAWNENSVATMEKRLSESDGRDFREIENPVSCWINVHEFDKFLIDFTLESGMLALVINLS